jgi:hypothetical protein
MNKEIIVEVALLTIVMHVVLTKNQSEIIKDQLEAVFNHGVQEGKILALESMLKKFASNKLEGALVPVANIVPEGAPL